MLSITRMGCAEPHVTAWEQEGVGMEMWPEKMYSRCPLHGDVTRWARLLQQARFHLVWNHAAGWTSESCLCEPFDLPLAVQGICLTRSDQACVKCHQSHRNHTTQSQLLSLWAFLTLSAIISFPDKTGPPDTWDVLVITVHQHFSHRPTQSECTPRCHRGKNQSDHRQQGGKSGLDILILWHS